MDFLGIGFWYEGFFYEKNYKKEIKNNLAIISEKIRQEKGIIKLINLDIEKKPTVYIFSPHPDDEILCCANTIKALRNKKIPVKIIIFTNGDAKDIDNKKSIEYGKIRKKESIRALSILDIEVSDIFFLGFPDGNLDELGDEIVSSPFTGKNKTDKNDYKSDIFYKKSALIQIIKEIFSKNPPKEIYIPSLKDTHNDHKFVGKIAREIIKKENLNIPIYQYIIHRNNPIKKDYFDDNKWNLIQIFNSQFHNSDNNYYNFMRRFAEIPEKFYQ